MNTDLSVAPEIAQLAAPIVVAKHAAAAHRTDGRIAGDLADLAATPQRWWDLVRFDSSGPARIALPDTPGTWLLVLPPGAATDCDCQQATALAGEAVETAGHGAAPGASAPPRPLRPGRVRVHGARAVHRLRAVGPGYSVTLHCPRGDDPPAPPGMGGLRPPISPPREDAAKNAAPPALWLGLSPVVAVGRQRKDRAASRCG